MRKWKREKTRILLISLLAVGVLFTFGVLPVCAVSYNNGGTVWVQPNTIYKELGSASNNVNDAAISLALKQVGYGSDGNYEWYYIRVVVIGLGVDAPYDGPDGEGWSDADDIAYSSGAIYSLKVVVQAEVSGWPSRATTRGNLQPDSSSQDNNEDLQVTYSGAHEEFWTEAQPIITMAVTAMGIIAAAAGTTFLPAAVVLTAVSLMAGTSTDLAWGYEPWWQYWPDDYGWIEYAYGAAVYPTYGHYPYDAPEEAVMTTYFWWRVPKSGTHKITVSASLRHGEYYFTPYYGRWGFRSTNTFTGVSLKVKAP